MREGLLSPRSIEGSRLQGQAYRSSWETLRRRDGMSGHRLAGKAGGGQGLGLSHECDMVGRCCADHISLSLGLAFL
jgi:hypothetical protein